MKLPQLLPLLIISVLLSPLTANAQDAPAQDPFTTPNPTVAKSQGPLLSRDWTVDRGFFVSEEKKIDVVQTLKDMGVCFPSGSQASYNTKTQKLTVKNTEAWLDKVDSVIAEYQSHVQKQNLAKQPQLYRWSWKIPKDFIENIDTDADMLKADVEMYLDLCMGVLFHEERGSYAVCKNGKITVVHNKETLERLDQSFEPYRKDGYKISAIGEMKQLEAEAIEKLMKKKPKKLTKKKFRTRYGEPIDVEAYYKARREREDWHDEEE